MSFTRKLAANAVGILLAGTALIPGTALADAQAATAPAAGSGESCKYRHQEWHTKLQDTIHTMTVWIEIKICKNDKGFTSGTEAKITKHDVTTAGQLIDNPEVRQGLVETHAAGPDGYRFQQTIDYAACAVEWVGCWFQNDFTFDIEVHEDYLNDAEVWGSSEYRDYSVVLANESS